MGKQFTNAALLNNVLLSSLSDVSRPIMEEGLARTMGLTFRGLLTGFKEIQMGVEQARLAGTALDTVLSTRAKSFVDIGEPFSPDVTKFERGVDRAEEMFFTATGLNHWNGMMKGFTSALVSTRILELSKRVANGTARPGELGKAARAGLSEGMLRRIAAEEKNWIREGGSIFANVDEWADQEAIFAMRGALINDVDKTVITPGVADLPVWVDNKYLSVVSHLKSFAFASTSRILLSGMQQANASVVSGVVAAVGLGMLSAHLKDLVAGRDNTDKDLQFWIAEGVDRSGVMGMLVDMDDMAAKVSKGQFPGIMNTIKGADTRRFKRTDTLEALVPTASLVRRAQRGAEKLINDGDPAGMINILPLHNHFLLVGGLEALDRLQE